MCWFSYKTVMHVGKMCLKSCCKAWNQKIAFDQITCDYTYEYINVRYLNLSLCDRKNAFLKDSLNKQLFLAAIYTHNGLQLILKSLKESEKYTHNQQSQKLIISNATLYNSMPFPSINIGTFLSHQKTLSQGGYLLMMLKTCLYNINVPGL